jgi:hypothetical protein
MKTKEDYKTEFLHFLYNRMGKIDSKLRVIGNEILVKFDSILTEIYASLSRQPMSEEFKQKLCDNIKDSLRGATLLNWYEDDSNKLGLLDHLSFGETVDIGRNEIDNLVEQIYDGFDLLSRVENKGEKEDVKQGIRNMNEMDFLYWLWKRGLMQTIPITELDNLADEYKQDKPAEETPDAQTEFERTNACYGNHTGD